MTFEHAARGAADPERLAAEMGVTLDEAADMCPASYQWAERLNGFAGTVADLTESFRRLNAALRRSAWQVDTFVAAARRWAEPDPMPAVTSCLSAALRPPELRQPPSWVIPHPKVGQAQRDAQALAGEIERAQQHLSFRALLGERVWGPEYGAWR